jgi:AraC-like DNA-binding protein
MQLRLHRVAHRFSFLAYICHYLSQDDKDLSVRDSDVPIRASALRGFAALVSELGGSGPELLAASGLDETDVAGRDAFLSLGVVEGLLEGAASRLSVPDFGLRMAAQQDLDFMGPVAVAIENSRTMGEALECAKRYLFVHSPALSLAPIADPLGNPEVIGLRYRLGTAAQSIDYGIAIVHRILFVINGAVPYGLRSVQLPHPPLAPEAVYKKFFAAQVTFGSTSAVLRVPRQLLLAPVSGGNDLLRDIAIDYLETHFGHIGLPVSDLVAEMVVDHLGFDIPDLSKVARLLKLHPRTLQRILSAEGTSFNNIVDEVRRDQTLKLITTTQLSFSQIATRVGMREQTSLARAVRRWFNTSPSRLRGETANASDSGIDERSFQ